MLMMNQVLGFGAGGSQIVTSLNLGDERTASVRSSYQVALAPLGSNRYMTTGSRASNNPPIVLYEASGTTLTQLDEDLTLDMGANSSHVTMRGLTSTTALSVCISATPTARVISDSSGNVVGGTSTAAGNNGDVGILVVDPSATTGAIILKHTRISSEKMTVRPFSVSGTTVSFSSLDQNGPTDYTDVYPYGVALSSSKLLASTHDTLGILKVCVVTYSPTTASFGTELTVDTGLTTNVSTNSGGFATHSLLRLSDTVALLTYSKGTVIKAVLLEVSGSSVATLGSTVTLVADNSADSEVAVAQLDSLNYMLIYVSNTSAKAKVATFTIENNTIGSVAASLLVSDNNASKVNVIKLSDGTAIVGYILDGSTVNSQTRVITYA